jgi:hypothetical protein
MACELIVTITILNPEDISRIGFPDFKEIGAQGYFGKCMVERGLRAFQLNCWATR